MAGAVALEIVEALQALRRRPYSQLIRAAPAAFIVSIAIRLAIAFILGSAAGASNAANETAVTGIAIGLAAPLLIELLARDVSPSSTPDRTGISERSTFTEAT